MPKLTYLRVQIRRAAFAPFTIPAENHTAPSFMAYNDNGVSFTPHFPVNNMTHASEPLIDRLVHGFNNIYITGHGRGPGYTDPGYLAPAYDVSFERVTEIG